MKLDTDNEKLLHFCSQCAYSVVSCLQQSLIFYEFPKKLVETLNVENLWVQPVYSVQQLWTFTAVVTPISWSDRTSDVICVFVREVNLFFFDSISMFLNSKDGSLCFKKK